MKAILVIDMPVVCGECDYCLISNDGSVYCSLTQCFCSKDLVKDKEKELWCPLKPMPSKRKSMVEWVDANVKTHDITEYDKGWNDCIEFLEGEDK